MTHEEVKRMLEGTGLRCAYDKFPKKAAPGAPPFICFLYTHSDNFAADGVVYQRIEALRIELYTDAKDPALEKRVADALTAAGLCYDRDEDYIETEKMHMTVFSTEILLTD